MGTLFLRNGRYYSRLFVPADLRLFLHRREIRKSLFSSSEFTDQRNGKYPEQYWLLLILLHTGARREEIAQLGVNDVREEEGIWFFHITTEEDEVKPSRMCTASDRYLYTHT